MTRGNIKSYFGNHNHLLFALTLVLATYFFDSLLDTILEGEDLHEQLLSPPRLLLLLVIMGCASYVIRLRRKHTSLENSMILQSAAMDASIDGIAIFDTDQKLIYSNDAHTRLFGYDNVDQIIGQNWRFFYTDEEVREFYGKIKPALLSSGQWRGETTGTRRDGSKFPHEITLARVEGLGFIRIVRDITEKKRYQIELERKAGELEATNRELEAFSYTLSHDMRGYITRLFSAGQMLSDCHAPLLDEDGKYLIGCINRTSEEMEQLVESIQLLSSMSQSRVELEPVNLSELANSIAAEFRLNEPGRRVEFLIEPDLIETCDAKLAKVALDNLIGNAWKYTGNAPSPRIEIGRRNTREGTVLFVGDNGIGFEMAEAGELFEPFRRLSSAADFPGTGIGLATVQRVVQLHGGILWGVGEPGKGATFYFSLDRQPAAS